MGHSTGWKVTFAAGLVPLSAGLSSMVSSWISYANPSSEHHSMLGTLGFTVDQVAQNPALAHYFKLQSSVGAVNIVGAAVYVLVASYVGLRAGQRWAFWSLLFSLVWVGFNDAYAATRYFMDTKIPFLMAPWSFVTLMVVGLAMSASTVLRQPADPR